MNPYSLNDSNVGVFILTGKNDVEYPFMKKEIHSNTSMVGCSKSMVSNRISYALNLKGNEENTVELFSNSIP